MMTFSFTSRFSKYLLLALFTAITSSAWAQTDGTLIDYVGTTRDNSAVLDVRSSTQGFLAPRISIPNLAVAAPVTSPVNGLMVYNTNGTTGEGYYYWNGTLWTRFISGNSTPLSGTGVANKVAFWSSPTNLSQNTNFHWDNATTRLGIGITNPGAKLTVRSDATDPGTYDDDKTLFVSGSFGSGQTYDGGVEFRHDNLTQGIGFGFNTIYQTGTNANEILNLIGKGTGAITLNAYGGATGNVGIGTTAPSYKLDVTGNVRITSVLNVLPTVANSGYVQLVAGNTTKTGFIAWFKPDGNRQAYMGFDNTNLTLALENGSDLAILNGNVGIGTNAPNCLFTVGAPLTAPNIGANASVNSTGNNPLFVGETTTGTGVMIGYAGNDIQGRSGANFGANGNLLLNRYGGNVSIGTPTAGYKLTVNGQPAANGFTAFTNYSDVRLKKNIQEIGSSLLKVMQLRPVEFQYNDTYLKLYNDSTSANRIHKGFIAQEIKEIFPEMVGNVDIEGTEYLDLNLSNLQVYMVKAMQEQQQMIEELKRQNELMQQEINALKNK